MQRDRVADYAISEQAFLSLLQSFDGKTLFRLRGLPDRPRIIGVYHDPARRLFRVRIESPELAEVVPGDTVPWGALDITAERYGHEDQTDEELSAIAAQHAINDSRESLYREDNLDNEDLHYQRGWLLNHIATLKGERDAMQAELASLRAIFSDYVQESVVAEQAYRQGWRDCQRQTTLRDGHG